ncbi:MULTISPECIES: MBOAT family O-acyltransferase [unclassified Coleofasciculus]|uniref:MBOAT family O-acyltransferase n=1 Tax=unclassified Coleofasciculus TaxID=2692782 RepID=UPI00187E7E72|nr:MULTISPECIES: MBOAT family protein [unclassified Coleofasciculus]MBE9125806.1 MBOAT family protein [Coleofasciculus sp. LEGE 07081]MBE9149009.1 MBOAT family protein [Coleofasciculus sp. LEGE 07092]
MLFNSYVFIFIFLPITLILFFGLVRFRLTKAATIWLTVSSLIFYGYWNIAYLPLLLISILFNHQMGKAIESAKPRERQAKNLLWIGIIVNIAIIAYYKYANFLLSSVNGVFNTNLTRLEIILPLGISFYTFTQIAYLVDAYRGETKDSNYDILTYSLFISYFPQLIAGPILRHDELINQFRQKRHFIFSQKNMALGLTMFSLGLSKKVLIADNISPWVAPVFDNPDAVSFIEAWVGALSYTFQLYFDFSGYSDMAIGLGLMFNIRLPINFDSPYKSTSIIEFWRRWHITLSNFLRDYLYIPLGGSRRGEVRRYTNLFITMLLGGLWHGAGWTYVVWGGLHGIYLSVNHWWRKLNIPLPKLVGWAMTFFAVVAGWVLFRSKSLPAATEILQAMVGMKGIVLPGEAQGKLSILTQFGLQLKSWNDLVYLPEVNGSKLVSILVLVGLTLCVTLLPNTQQILRRLKPTWWWAAWVGVLASFSLLSLNRVSEFLYFQF